MPSKTSKARKIRCSLKRVAPGYSDLSDLEFSRENLRTLAQTIARDLKAGDRIFLEGEMGTGKSTFARFLLEELGERELSEGSPSFPIAHEYRTRIGDFIHIDFYRLQSEEDIEEAGIPAYFWERNATILTEWISAWPKLSLAVLKDTKRKGARAVEIRFEFSKSGENLRNIRVKSL